MFSKSETVKFKFKLGEILKDKVTGLTGAVMVRAEYSTGCHHYGIQQTTLSSDGKPYDWEWLDQSRLERVKDVESVSFDVDSERTSGPMPSGPQQ